MNGLKKGQVDWVKKGPVYLGMKSDQLNGSFKGASRPVDWFMKTEWFGLVRFDFIWLGLIWCCDWVGSVCSD